ncbi:hypothetical protein [Delftia sp. K82]|jgi:hypothetical protein|nr:hypothetical protein [Delftia sp. K82]
MNIVFCIFALLSWFAGTAQFMMNNPLAGAGGFIASGLFAIAWAIYAKK